MTRGWRGLGGAMALLVVVMSIHVGRERWPRAADAASEPRAAVTADATERPVADARAPVFGLNVDLQQYDAAARRRVVDRLAAAGIRHVRQPIRWAEVETTRDAYAWAAVDAIVADLDRAGLRAVFVIETSPAWARRDAPPAKGLWLCEEPAAVGPTVAHRAPPTDPADLARFAGTLVGRYRDRLWAVEVWPEANLLPQWRATGPDPEDYARLLRQVATAIHRIAPRTVIVSGALAPTTDLGVCYLSDVVFLDRLAATGALSAVDAVGIAPFGLREAADTARADREALNFARAAVLADVLARRGVDRPLWASAWGWNSLPATWHGRPSPWGDHPPSQAARFTAAAYARARRDWPWMGAMFLWHLQPNADAVDPEWGFALWDRADQPTWAWPVATDLAAGRLPDLPPPPPPPSPVGRLATLFLLGSGAVAIAWLARPWLAPPGRRLVRRLAVLHPAAAVTGYVGLVVLDLLLPWPLGLGALALLVWLTSARPALAVAAVAAMAPFNYRLALPLGPLMARPVELLLLAAIGGRLLPAYLGRGPWVPANGNDARPAATSGATPWSDRVRRLRALPRQFHPLDWTALALVLWAGLSPLWAEMPGVAWREWRTVIVEPVVLYALVRSLSNARRGARAALAGLVGGGVAAAIWALGGVIGWGIGRGGAAVVAEGVVRAMGPYSSPNNLSLFLGRFVPLLGALCLWDRGRRRVAAGLGAALVAVTLVATFSRGALLIGLPASALYLGLVAVKRAGWRRRRVVAGLAVAVIVLGVALAPFADTPRLRSAVAVQPGTTLYIRWRLWQSAVAMGRDHPVLGVGLDNFLYQYRDRYVQRDAVQERFLNHPHNALLDWWTRLGLPGLGLFALLVVGNLVVARRALRRSEPEWPLAAGVAGMQVYTLAHGMVDNSFFLVDLALSWWVAQACLLALADGATVPSARGERQ